MALYPQTTCFYKAIINSLPETATSDYELLFEDASYPEGYSPALMVAQRYVIAFKNTKKSGNTSSWPDENDASCESDDNWNPFSIQWLETNFFSDEKYVLIYNNQLNTIF